MHNAPRHNMHRHGPNPSGYPKMSTWSPTDVLLALLFALVFAAVFCVFGALPGQH